MKDINTDRIKETAKQKERDQREKRRNDAKNIRKKSRRSEDTRSDAPQDFPSKFGDKEREIHEAYQILLAEYLKRKQQRKRQARIDAIRDKEANEVRCAKPRLSSSEAIEDLFKVSATKRCKAAANMLRSYWIISGSLAR